ncbi:hypothetical protein BDZ89DRAFT_1134711 [Hymenopellis radicata]|nr:hypothetical protein BDZ89DRAFT_1134711 [Hymenopellis radicata]
MSDAELLVIPNIPGDIVRSILETLAIMSRPDALKLVLVSKTVRKWIDIVLYHAVTILSIPKFYAFVNAIESREKAGEASFFAISVKYLLLDIPFKSRAEIFAEKIMAIMSACSGLVSFGLRCHDPKFVASLVNPSFPRLQRLSLFHYGANTPLEYLPPSLTHLTYLRGTFPPALLQTVPLTHLHVILADVDVCRTGLVAMKQVLEAMPNTIQLCVFSFRNVRVDPEGLNAIRDPRVILLNIAADTSYYMGRAEEDLPKHGSCWNMLHRDCGFLLDGDLDSWEFCANLMKERAKRMQCE